MAGLFGGGDEPKVETASRMPDPEDPAIKEERRRKLEEMRKRGGRESTILSEELAGASGKLGA